ncbi:MAG: LemA family protein, partial [Acidovorax sp.]
QTFGGFDAHMQRLLALLAEVVAAQAPGQAAVAMPAAQADDPITALEGAAAQLGASLTAARARPLQPDVLAALAAARTGLHACWGAAVNHHASPAAQNDVDPTVAAGEPPGRAHRADEMPGTMGASQPTAQHGVMPWQNRWVENVAHANQAVEIFNGAVRQYNEAIAQFPASVLARLFGFKAASGL